MRTFSEYIKNIASTLWRSPRSNEQNSFCPYNFPIHQESVIVAAHDKNILLGQSQLEHCCFGRQFEFQCAYVSQYDWNSKRFDTYFMPAKTEKKLNLLCQCCFYSYSNRSHIVPPMSRIWKLCNRSINARHLYTLWNHTFTTFTFLPCKLSAS